jgi:hypothetical protein
VGAQRTRRSVSGAGSGVLLVMRRGQGAVSCIKITDVAQLHGVCTFLTMLHNAEVRRFPSGSTGQYMPSRR